MRERAEERQHEHVDEADLRARHVGIRLAPKRHLEPALLLVLALLPELAQDAHRPLLRHRERSARRANVRRVDDSRDQQQPIGLAGCRIRRVPVQDALVQRLEVRHVVRHVRPEHDGKHRAAELPCIGLAELRRDVEPGVLQQLERSAHVVVLQHRSVVVPDCHGVADVGQKRVRAARMLVVVRCARHQRRKLLRCRHERQQTGLLQHHKTVLRHVGRVHRVVVRILGIAALQCVQEQRQRRAVNHRDFAACQAELVAQLHADAHK